MKPELLTNKDAAITTHDEKKNLRSRPYELYEVRGRINGRAEEDWLQAEGEVTGATNEKPSEPQPQDRYDKKSSVMMIGPWRCGERCSN